MSTYLPDYGLYFQETIGPATSLHITLLEITAINRIGVDQFSFTEGFGKEIAYALTCDFTRAQLDEIIKNCSPEVADALKQFADQPYVKPIEFSLRHAPLFVGFSARLGDLISLPAGSFIPFIIVNFNFPTNQPEIKVMALPAFITHAMFVKQQVRGLAIPLKTVNKRHKDRKGYFTGFVCYPEVPDLSEAGTVLLLESTADYMLAHDILSNNDYAYAIQLTNLTAEEYFTVRALYTSAYAEFQDGFGRHGFKI